MKNLELLRIVSLCLVGVSIFGSCNKNIELDAITEGSISFDIKQCHYGSDSTYQFVKGIQVEPSVLDIIEYDEQKRYLWFQDSVENGKIQLVASLQYDLETGVPSEYSFRPDMNKLLVEFIFVEDKDKLVKDVNNSYHYTNKLDLYNSIMKNDWSDNVIQDNGKSQVLITFPQDTILAYFHLRQITSTDGLYYDHEYVEVNNVEYNVESDEITMEIKFNLDIKTNTPYLPEPYKSFEITKGEVKVLIQ